MEPKALLAVALGAALGGVLRFVVAWAFVRALGPGFPYGTLFINVSGSFLIGVVAELAVTRTLGVTPLARVFIATGILGGYTTFSTFSLDAVTLLSEGAGAAAPAYVGASVLLGVFAAYGGQLLVRLALRSMG